MGWVYGKLLEMLFVVGEREPVGRQEANPALPRRGEPTSHSPVCSALPYGRMQEEGAHMSPCVHTSVCPWWVGAGRARRRHSCCVPDGRCNCEN